MARVGRTEGCASAAVVDPRDERRPGVGGGRHDRAAVASGAVRRLEAVSDEVVVGVGAFDRNELERLFEPAVESADGDRGARSGVANSGAVDAPFDGRISSIIDKYGCISEIYYIASDN